MTLKPTYEELERRIAALEGAAGTPDQSRAPLGGGSFSPSWIDCIQENLLVISPEGTVTDVNASFLASIGGKREDVIGRPCQEATGAGSAENREYPCQLKKVLSEGSPQRFLRQRKRPGGSTAWVDVLLSPCKDESGRVVSIIETSRDVTALFEAETRLSESEQMFRRIVENTDDIIMLTQPDGTIDYITPSSYAVMGYRPDELIGKRPWPVHPDDSLKVKESFREAREGVPGTQLKYRVITKHGLIRWVSHSWSPIMKDGQLQQAVSVVRDITRVGETAEKLRISEEKFAKAFDASPDAIMITRLSDGLFLEVNNSFVHLTQYSRAESVGRTSAELNLWVDPAERTAVIRSVGNYGACNEVEASFRKKDGRIMRGLVSARLIELEGEPCLISVTRDITASKKAEEELRESEEKFRAITASAQEAILMMDANGCITYWNEAAEKMFGYNAAEAIGRELHPLLTPSRYMEAYRRGLAVFQATGSGAAINHILELDAVNKKGEEFPVELSLSAVKLKGVWNAAGIIRDISERKAAEKERENLQAQLRQAQKMEAIGTLAGGIAHDFNNILSAIIGYTEMSLSDLPQGDPISDSLRQVLKAGHRARDLVKQILAFSRQADIQRTPVMVHLIVKEAMKLLRASLPTTISIQHNLRSDTGAVMADPSQIHQIMMNLCTNAHDAMKETGGVLGLSLTSVGIGNSTCKIGGSELEPGSYIKLTVSDDGQGMDEATMQRIFDPYFTTKVKGAGTGLGLAVVHGIVKSLGGAIAVWSQPGEGTRFDVYLPEIAGTPYKEPKESPVMPRGAERILWVDDEEPLVKLGRLMLERLGYTVQGLTSSREALEKFRADPDGFDLIITDQTMPDITGAELAAEAMRIRPEIPVILCTGYSERVTPDQAAEMGIKAFLLKPVLPTDLAAAIRRVLAEEKSPGGV